MPDTEYERCSFCGDEALVAVSEQEGPAVRICEACAVWALDQIQDTRKLETEKPARGKEPARG